MNDYIQIGAAIAGIVSGIIAILEYIKIKKKNVNLQEQVDNIASTGVALGYYYNFVVNVFSKLREHVLKVEIYKDNSNELEEIKEFNSDNVELHIIMPENLQIDSMNSAIKKMRIHRKGDIVSKGSERNFGINFMYDEEGKLIILDFPKPLNAIREHMIKDPKFANLLNSRGTLGNEDVFESREWRKHEKKELENFIRTIKLLMKRGRVDEGQAETKFVNIKDVPDSIDGK